MLVKLNDDDIVFKVMSKTEISQIIKMQNPNHLYFNDTKDPQYWTVKKIVLKQLSKTLKRRFKEKQFL